MCSAPNGVSGAAVTMNVLDAIRSAAVRLDDSARDYDALLNDIGNCSLVLWVDADQLDRRPDTLAYLRTM